MTASRYSPECRLVLGSAAMPATPARVRGLAREVTDWSRVLLLAEREYAASALWRQLRDAGPDVPSAVLEQLRRLLMVSELRMGWLSRRMQETVAALAERGIAVMLLKGAAVGAMVDPTFGSRPMSDVDLLVRTEHLGPATAALIAAGWPQLDDPTVHELLEHQHHLPPFVDPRMPALRLELHRSLLPQDHPFRLTDDDFWETAQRAATPFAGALVPAPEHLLLHASLHFAWQHMMVFGAWRTFRAAAVAITHPGFDWARFVTLAQEARAGTSAYWTLRLGVAVGALAAPDGALAALAPPTPEWARVAIERHFVASLLPGEGPVSPSTQVARLLWRAAIRPSWSGHDSFVRWDPEHRWERARGQAIPTGRLARIQRQVSQGRHWWAFLSQTLLSRRAPRPPAD